MLRFSRKLPISEFFRYSAILIAILTVVLAGKGVGALQEAGVIGVTPLAGVPRLPMLGLFPTAEAIGAQLIALAAVLLGFRAAGRPRAPAAAQPNKRAWHCADCRSLWRSAEAPRKGEHMAGVNKVILVGNLGARSRIALASTTVAKSSNARRDVGKLEGPRRQAPGTDRMAQRRHLQRESRPGRQELFEEGLKVYLEGQIQTRKWQDQTGNDRYTTEVVLQRFRGELVLLDGRGEGGGWRRLRRRRLWRRFGGSSGGGGSRRQSRPQPAAFDTDLDDDVPF